MAYPVITLVVAAMLAFASIDHVFADTIDKADNVQISWPAIEELLDLTKDLGNITNVPAAIYRDDLPSDYVAYWLVEFNSSQYAVVSASAQTGDFKVSVQGDLPSPITVLDLTADGYGKSCYKYLMLSTDGKMMCRNKDGDIVATTAEDMLLTGNYSGEDPKFEHAHEYIEQHRSELSAQWAARAGKVAKTSIWGNDNVVLRNDTSVVPSYMETYVRPGGVIYLPIYDDTVSVKVGYNAEGNTQSTAESKTYQAVLCRVLSFCSVNNDFTIDLSHKKTLLHQNYIEIAINNKVPVVFSGIQSIEFELRVTMQTGDIAVNHYSLDTTSTRQKRSEQYQRYSGYTEYAIPNELYTPNFWQHKMKNGCYVGCAPVAWAMLFGYHEHRSSSKPWIYGTGSQDLYKCGRDGTTGWGNCKFPSSSYYDKVRLEKYIEKIAKMLGTFCTFGQGATLHTNMVPMKRFFKARQTSGRPDLVQTNDRWEMAARDYIGKQTRKWIRQGLPVVVGITDGGMFRWHYVVATKYKVRHRKVRTCPEFEGIGCYPWQTEWDYMMYAHMGYEYNPKKQKPPTWYLPSMELHYAGTAIY